VGVRPGCSVKKDHMIHSETEKTNEVDEMMKNCFKIKSKVIN